MPLNTDGQFAGYTLMRQLGSGEMGEVYLARHPRLPRLEALKVLRADLSADPNFEQRFIHEADQASGLWHPHIVGVHDRGQFDGQLWLAMDYVSGADLSAVLAERHGAGLSTAEVMAVVSAVGDALDHAHHRGLLHRAVKPENIMISRPDDGSAPRILLSDFGMPRPTADDADLTQAGPVATDTTTKTTGSFNYSAPEQLRGAAIDGRMDQYALAATAYHLLTGAPPFAHTNPVAVINAHLTAPPPRPGAIRPELAAADAVFARALAKDPTQRFARCGDFAAALADALRRPAPPAPGDPTMAASPVQPHLLPPNAGQQHGPGRPSGAAPPPPGDPAPPPPQWPLIKPRKSRKRVAVSVLSAVALVAVLAVGGIVAVQKFSGPDAAQRAAQDHEAARLTGQHYLEALATGDARTALSLSAQQPADPQLLTDKALDAQLSATPITNILVTNVPSQDPNASPDSQHLKLSAKFGATPSETVITAHKKDDQWKLDTTTIAVTIDPPPHADAAMKTLTVSGIAINGASAISVFPGTPQISSSNRYIDITAPTTPLLLEALSNTAKPPTITPVITLNDAGRQASLEAIDRKLRACFTGVEPAEGCCPPDGCRGLDALKIISMETTEGMAYELNPNTMMVDVTGLIHYQVEEKRGSRMVPNRLDLKVGPSGVDLTVEPPVHVRK